VPRLRKSCSISIGAPLDSSSVEPESRRNTARALTDELMERIATLSGQQYVAQYSSRSPRPTTAPKQGRGGVHPHLGWHWARQPASA
jgi:hypothetical protein